jgi:arylsulfatase A-like enzyme
VVFSSDNGPEDIHLRNASHSGVGSAGPFRGRKRSLYNGGTCVPFIVRWPAGQNKPGTVDNNSVLSAVDLFPTFCSLASVDIPDDSKLNREDVSDIFAGNSRARKAPLMWDWRFQIPGHVMHKSPRLAIRDGEWKLLMNPDKSRVELYNISNDPSEMNNMAKRNAVVTKRLIAKLVKWNAELPESPIDELAGKNDYPWPK